MLDFLVNRPIAVLMTFLGVFILGLVVSRTLPVSLLPEIPIPQMTVQVSAPNTTARELENTVVQPLRNQLLQVSKLRDIESETRNSGALIRLDFNYGANTDLAFIEVNEQIDQLMGLLPRELERPRVLKANVADIPVFYLSVSSTQLAELAGEARDQALLDLSEFARMIIKRRIEQLPQVAFADVSGYAEPQITILPDWERLLSLKVSENQLQQVLRANNVDLGSILVKDGQYQYNIRFLSELKTREDVAGIYLDLNGRVLQLRDIAEIRLEPRPRRGLYRHNGQDAVVFSIRKQADAQLFDLKKEMQALLDNFAAEYPLLEFSLHQDQSEILQVSIDNLRTSLLYGMLFAFLILFLFFREWRTPVLIGLAVPGALIMSLLGFYLLGLSINTISLAGLILGVGLMIDNSIIVIENIRQQRARGLTVTAAAVEGGEEVIRPLISSALTTCSVFLPLIFLSGIGGALFYDQALSITIALTCSLLLAYILLPTLVRLLARKQQPAAPGRAGFYTRSVDQALRFRGLTVLLFVAGLGGLYWLAGQLNREAFPQLTRQALEMTIDWNQSINLAENQRRIDEICRTMNSQNAGAFIGEQQFMLEQQEQSLNEARLYLAVQNDLRQEQENLRQFMAANFPDASVRIQPARNMFDRIFRSEAAPLTAFLQSRESNRTPGLADLSPLLDTLERAGWQPVRPSTEDVYNLQIDKEKALRYQVSYETAYSRLKTLFNQNEVELLKSTNQYIPIVLGSNMQSLQRVLDETLVENQSGEQLPLREFVRIERENNYKQLSAGRAGEALKIDLSTGTEAAIPYIRGLVNRAGLSVYFDGELFEDRRLTGELFVIMGISLLLLYLILAAQFESLVQPLIVILTVPMGVFGALAALYLAGESLNLIAIIGLIVMSGIVVNDAILKVDMMNRLSRTESLTEAIHGAGLRRLRPILMTSLTTMLALAPVLFSSGLGAELQRPLAIAVIGGLALGTVSSLYFIPVFYWFLYKHRHNH